MREATLDAATATAFLARLGEHIDYNINIMDREGVIIASRDSTRIGSFHDAAKRLIATGASIECVYPGPSMPAGVRQGVNLPIVHKAETIGVVGITGDPDEVLALAYAVKTSVESMVELEAWKEKALRRQDSRNLLMNLFLYEDEASRSTLESLALKLGVDSSIPRAPLVILPSRGKYGTDTLSAIKQSPMHGGQDLVFSTPEGALLVFKTIHFGDKGFFVDFETEIRGYIESLRGLSREARSLAVYVGTMQTDLGRYHGAYRQTLWLAEHFPDPGEAPVFLFDHLLDYLSNRIPRSEFVAALDATLGLFPPGFLGELGPSIEALARSALNSKEAAARLGVHRNTFSARMERVARFLGRDPRSDPVALDFLRLMLRYSGLRAPAVHGAPSIPPRQGDADIAESDYQG